MSTVKFEVTVGPSSDNALHKYSDAAIGEVNLVCQEAAVPVVNDAPGPGYRILHITYDLLLTTYYLLLTTYYLLLTSRYLLLGPGYRKQYYFDWSSPSDDEVHTHGHYKRSTTQSATKAGTKAHEHNHHHPPPRGWSSPGPEDGKYMVMKRQTDGWQHMSGSIREGGGGEPVYTQRGYYLLLLLATCYSLLATYYLLLTTYYSLLTTYYLLPTTLTTYYLLPTTYYLLLTTH